MIVFCFNAKDFIHLLYYVALLFTVVNCPHDAQICNVGFSENMIGLSLDKKFYIFEKRLGTSKSGLLS